MDNNKSTELAGLKKIVIGKSVINDALHALFGFHNFLPNQSEVVHAILDHRDTLAVMPTGGGKSLCYQLPAYLLPGTALVVSPLISLMKDQVDSACDIGLKAAFLNSSLPENMRRKVLSDLYSQKLDLLYVAPERLSMDTFFRKLKKVNLSLVAVDEAHCISEWGHDFRPDYLFLSEMVKHFPQIPITAFTATATHQVQQDIIEKLGLRDPFTLRASFNRPNLFYQVKPKEKINHQIRSFIQSNPNKSGIVYRTTRSSVENTAMFLNDAGIKALPYHAGLDDSIRKNNQELFNNDTVNVVVATIAFGMGIDKSNVRYVIHGDLPKNMEGYYQETGRSGRDGEPAHCLLFFGRGDIPKINYFINQVVDEREKLRLQKSLKTMASYAETYGCRRKRILGYFGEVYSGDSDKCCDVCSGDVEMVNATTDAQMILSAIARSGQYFGSSHIVDIVSGADTKKIRAMNHNKLKTYGVGKHKDKRYWWRVIDNLIAQKFITQTETQFPTLRLNARSSDILFGKMEVTIIKQNEPKPKLRKISSKHSNCDENLFDELRTLRREIAKKNHIPPYIVFSDKTLREMSYNCPEEGYDFLQITGVGDNKLEKYGKSFMSVIKTYLKNHPDTKHSSSDRNGSNNYDFD